MAISGRYNGTCIVTGAFLVPSGLVAGRTLNACIISSDQLLLILCLALSLTESKSTLSAHALGCPNLLDSLLESEMETVCLCSLWCCPRSDSLLLSRTIVGQVEFLYFLNNVVRLRKVRSSVAEIREGDQRLEFVSNRLTHYFHT